MNDDRDPSFRLPLERPLKLSLVLSSAIALLTALASIGGIVYGSAAYPTHELLNSFMPTDVTLLAVGLPMLVGSMAGARHGRWVGLLLWPGALLFILYNYVAYLLAMPLNVFFLLHLALVALCVYGLIDLLTCVDSEAIAQRLAGTLPQRFSGGLLAVLGLLFLLRALSVLLMAVLRQTPLAATDIAVSAADALVAPAWVVCGLLLLRGKAFGSITGLGLLFQASMLFVSLAIWMLLQPLLAQSALVATDLVVILLMGAITFVPFWLYLRGVVLGQRAE